MQKIKSLHKYFLASFFVVMVVNSSSLVLADDISAPGTSAPNGSISSIPPSIQQTILSSTTSLTNTSSNSSSTSSSNSPSQSTIRETARSKAFTEWIKTACLNSRNLENCQKERIKDVMTLNHNMNVAISKKQEICNEIVGDSVKKTECIKDSYVTTTRNSQVYLGVQSESFSKNKTYQEDIKIIDEEYKKSEKSCNKLYFSSERVSCLNKAKKARSISQCVAGKTLRKTNFGDKYHSASYGGDIKKAKEAMKKDCEEEFKKKSASLNKTTN